MNMKYQVENCIKKCFEPQTSEMELLYGFSSGGLFVLVVGDGGVLEYKPVLFVWPQR